MNKHPRLPISLSHRCILGDRSDRQKAVEATLDIFSRDREGAPQPMIEVIL